MPLCVDMDGTLVRTDLLWESVAQAARRRPLGLAAAATRLFAGRAAFKRAVADVAMPGADALPYREELITRIKEARAAGRRTVLATASERRLGEAVAQHLGCFDEVVATDGDSNLKGAAKAAELARRFPDGFAYVGDSRADRPVWDAAAERWVVGRSRAAWLERSGITPDEVFEDRGSRSRPAAVLKAVRPHQWAKNGLVAVPFLASHGLADLGSIIALAVCFLMFCCLASAGYVVNDVLDLESDRRHPTKRRRPFAAGDLSIPASVVLVGALLALGLGAAAFFLPWRALVVGLVYLVATLTYSLVLKRLLLIDAIVLAGLYVVRIVGGGAAGGIELSFWLLAFGLALFASLAFAKRYAELQAARREGRERNADRGYRDEDLTMLSSLGPACGVGAVLLLGLYVHGSTDAEELYPTPQFLWLACPILLYWVSRVWFVAGRGHLDEDPVVWAFKDRPSLYCGGLVLVCFVLGSLG